MPSFLDNFLTPLKNQFTKTVQNVQPLFVDAVSRMGIGMKEVGQGLSPFYKENATQGQKVLDTTRSFMQSMAPTPEEAKQQGLIKMPGTDKYADITGFGTMKKVGAKAVSKVAQEVVPQVKKLPIFQGFQDLSTKIVEKLKGRSEVSKQFISDLTNSPDLKQTEKDIIRNVLEGSKGDKIAVQEFADKVKSELLPLKVKSSDLYETGVGKNPFAMLEERDFTPKYESISLPNELRGNVANYSEHIYESPIKTSAGDTHFLYTSKNYYGHTRIEDVIPKYGDSRDVQLKSIIKGGYDKEGVNKLATTRRVIEVQSDLYQKGNLEKEMNSAYFNAQDYLPPDKLKQYDKVTQRLTDLTFADNSTKYSAEIKQLKAEQNRLAQLGEKAKEKAITDKKQELSKLQQYNDPTAHFRMVREEVKQAAIDGKTKLQFPTGETAMKIEGLGVQSHWSFDLHGRSAGRMGEHELKVGREIYQIPRNSEKWIITDVLGDGKFKAVQKRMYDSVPGGKPEIGSEGLEQLNEMAEQFDISGKVDTNNPIYKFYEKDLGRYLKNKYNAQLIIDKQGVSWYELDIKPEQGSAPVEAFGMLPFMPTQNKDKNKKELFISK
jgi:hypothetical protein